MSYQIVIVKAVQKQLNQLPGSVAQRVIQKIQSLAEEPRPVGCVKGTSKNSAKR